MTAARLQLVLSCSTTTCSWPLAAESMRGLSAADLPALDGPALDRVVWDDDVNGSSARTLLDSDSSDGQAVVPCIDEQPRLTSSPSRSTLLLGRIRF